MYVKPQNECFIYFSQLILLLCVEQYAHLILVFFLKQHFCRLQDYCLSVIFRMKKKEGNLKMLRKRKLTKEIRLILITCGLSSMLTYLLLESPWQFCLGLTILFSESVTNSFQCASQPATLGIVNNTGNISVGNPMALQITPEQKSTFGQSLREIKYSSSKAIFSSSKAILTRGSFPTISKTSSATFLMILARGSQLLQTLCPKPKRSFFLFLTS